jgi:hypothetical protein
MIFSIYPGLLRSSKNPTFFILKTNSNASCFIKTNFPTSYLICLQHIWIYIILVWCTESLYRSWDYTRLGKFSTGDSDTLLLVTSWWQKPGALIRWWLKNFEVLGGKACSSITLSTAKPTGNALKFTSNNRYQNLETTSDLWCCT